MILDIPREKIDEILDSTPAQSSKDLRISVMKAWRRQEARFKDSLIVTNATMTSRDIDHYIQLDEASKKFLSQAAASLTLSPRVVHRSIKLARTIADMEDQNEIEVKHLAEAIQYRNKKMFVE